MKVELVLRTADLKKVPKWYDDLFSDYRVLKDGDRNIVDVPSDWEGFKDGTVIRLLKEFGSRLYVALAYITNDDNVIVTDLEGGKVDCFEEVIDGKVYRKYVKKKLRILKVLNEEEEIFEVKGYVLNLQYTEPVVKVLDVYSMGKLSGLSLEVFKR